MSCLIFDGKSFAAQKELELTKLVNQLHSKGKTIRVTSITFVEDVGSTLYTNLKKKAAERIGILYEPQVCSLTDDQGRLIQSIRELSFDASVTGVMIQKPSQQSWENTKIQNPNSAMPPFVEWWEGLTSAIDPQKDVDCLTQQNLNVILSTRAYSHEGRMDSFLMPATVKACLSILTEAKKLLNVTDEEWKQKKVLVIGKSDIVGKPLTAVLRRQYSVVSNFGKQELQTTDYRLQNFDIVISATGQANLIKGTMIKAGTIVIDVGSPNAEVELSSVEPKAAFLTPVPGGVGPVTVVSLMENILQIADR